jgi:hypothetical protein
LPASRLELAAQAIDGIHIPAAVQIRTSTAAGWHSIA